MAIKNADSLPHIQKNICDKGVCRVSEFYARAMGLSRDPSAWHFAQKLGL